MKEINNLRNEIEDITIKMMQMYEKRMSLAKKIGQVKKKTGMLIQDDMREAELNQKILKKSQSINLDVKYAGRLLNFLINESIKIQSTKSSSHLLIFNKAKELERQGRKIIHMEIGELDLSPPKILGKLLKDAHVKGFTKYGSSYGHHLLRKTIADIFPKINSDNIIISPGARFAIFAAITCLLKPGQEIIIIEPAWPAYKQCAIHAGIKTRLIKTNLENEWEPSIKEIKDSISPNTKMIVLNYPNNPTGKILSVKTQDAIVKLAKKNNLYILSDEVYSKYAFVNYKSILDYNYKKSIIVNSFSKSHAMTGLRIGYAIASKQIIDKMNKIHALCLTSVSEPIQYAAAHLLNYQTKKYTDTVKQRLEKITSIANQTNLKFIKPQGAMYLFIDMGEDGTKLALSLLKSGLAIAPGIGFGDYRNFVRVSACADIKALITGMNILKSV